MAGALFNSKVIKQEIREKYTMILNLYQQEVQTISDIFEKNYKQFKKVGFQVRLIVLFVSFAVDDKIVGFVSRVYVQYVSISTNFFYIFFVRVSGRDCTHLQAINLQNQKHKIIYFALARSFVYVCVTSFNQTFFHSSSKFVPSLHSK